MEAIDQFDDAAKQQMADALEAALAEIAFAGWEQLNGRPTCSLSVCCSSRTVRTACRPCSADGRNRRTTPVTLGVRGQPAHANA